MTEYTTITTEERIKRFADERLAYMEGASILFDDLQQEISNDFGANFPEMVYPLLLELCNRYPGINHTVTKVHSGVGLGMGYIDTPDRPWPNQKDFDQEAQWDWLIANGSDEDRYLHTITNLRWKKPCEEESLIQND